MTAELINNLLGNIIPIGLIIWLFYSEKRRKKILDVFHRFMSYIESGNWK